MPEAESKENLPDATGRLNPAIRRNSGPACFQPTLPVISLAKGKHHRILTDTRSRTLPVLDMSFCRLHSGRECRSQTGCGFFSSHCENWQYNVMLVESWGQV